MVRTSFEGLASPGWEGTACICSIGIVSAAVLWNAAFCVTAHLPTAHVHSEESLVNNYHLSFSQTTPSVPSIASQDLGTNL